MHSSHRLSRLLAITSSGALTAALAWLPAGPASAAVHNTFEAGGSSSSTFTGTGGPNACLLTSGDDSVSSTPVTFSSGTKKKSVHLSSTYTSTANSTDVTTVAAHYKGSLSIAKHHGDLSGFTMQGAGDATITRALGNSSECRTNAIIGVEATTAFTESKPGWLYVTRDTKDKNAEAVFVAVHAATNSTVVLEEYVGGPSHATERGFLTPGSYAIPEWLLALVAGPGALFKQGGVERSSLHTQMTGAFYVAGAAFGGTHGAAGAFVRFPGSISCRHHSAKLTWTGKAGQVASGSFSVNGHRSAHVSNPQAGHSVVLRHLSKTADNTISAKLSLNGGGTASATRAYVPCHS